MESLGLIEAIITTLLESQHYMFSKRRVVVDLPELVDMLEKLKIVIQRNGEQLSKPVEESPRRNIVDTNPEAFGLEGEALLRQAKEYSERIKQNADKYAENVLTNLQVIITKMMRNVENGKERLKKYKEVVQ